MKSIKTSFNELEASDAFKLYKVKLNTLIDLADVDRLSNVIEEDRNLKPNEYSHFYRQLLPSWIREHWSEDLLYNGFNLFDLLYNDYEPIFTKYLKDKGYDSQECFVSYEPTTMCKDSDEDCDGVFKMGFDIFGDNENECGWACFMVNYTGLMNKFREIKLDYKYDRPSYDEVLVTFDFGNGMFYNYKTNPPYEGLFDYYGDGGYVLRID